MKHYTFVMLKPDALRRNLVPDVIDYLVGHGYQIELFDYRLATKELIFQHYAEKISIEGDSFRIKSATTFNNKPVIPIILSSQSETIVKDIRTLIGATDPSKAAPDTIRGKWGIDCMDVSERENRCCENLFHASDSPESFAYEIKIWFDKDKIERFLK